MLIWRTRNDWWTRHQYCRIQAATLHGSDITIYRGSVNPRHTPPADPTLLSEYPPSLNDRNCPRSQPPTPIVDETSPTPTNDDMSDTWVHLDWGTYCADTEDVPLDLAIFVERLALALHNHARLTDE